MGKGFENCEVGYGKNEMGNGIGTPTPSGPSKINSLFYSCRHKNIVKPYQQLF